MGHYSKAFSDYEPNSDAKYCPCGINVSTNTSLPSSNIDHSSGAVLPDGYKRRRFQSDKLKLEAMEKENKKKGEEKEKEKRKSGIRISMRAGILIPVVLSVALFLVLLNMYLYGVGLSNSITAVRTVVSEQDSQNQTLQAEIDEKLSDTNVMQTAVNQLNMINISAAEPIEIDAADYIGQMNGLSQ